ncbi:esterase-like activity of phytase family protein [Methylobacillus flagellatus]|uniref:esterase-like activity of phytase family protein n=1 Tax=Methylobacillus flagellatus TaxID=405 RepID=UPI0010F6C4C4|nr:esterase-like activity of phytase family protein [Methylobacillus flagellatus]
MVSTKRTLQFTQSALAIAVLAALPQMANAAKLEPSFQRISTYVVCNNTSCDRDTVEETVAEIITVSQDGNTLIYTDSPTGKIGFVNISNPEQPVGLGTIQTEGEPTSVVISGDYILAGINTSSSFTSPSGHLAVYSLAACRANLAACTPIRKIDMQGQPDSVAVSPNGRYAAVVIENERDEDITVGEVEGGLPQLPAGFVNIVDTVGAPSAWRVRKVELTGLAAYAGNDPEPEYISINKSNIAAVTLQENNHIAFINLAKGKLLQNFDAGKVNLSGIDTVRNKLIELNGSKQDVPREPDSIAWLGNGKVVTANEGDLFGGSRGFTMFNRKGKVLFDAGASFDQLTVRLGHYLEERNNKGSEPEGLTIGKFGGREFVFVGSERGNIVGVYRKKGNNLEFKQALPTGAGPEGLLAIPGRNLFVASTEVDDPVRSQINIFRLESKLAAYPQIESALKSDGKPIPWGALSALSADNTDANKLYTVHDNFYNNSRIYTVDVSKQPAKISSEIELKKAGANVSYDLEGIAQRSNGSFWLASEGAGNAPSATSLNLLIETAADGTVIREVSLPASVNAKQKSNGYEGVAVTGSVGNDEKVYVAFQREWTNDPAGMVRIGVYTPALDTTVNEDAGEWKFFYYPLDAVTSPAGGWVGLSEITALGGDKFAIIERDNQAGPNARIKRVYNIDVSGITPVAEGGSFPVVSKTLSKDVLPLMQAGKGWVHDKLEGLAKAADGTVYAVTDNDGVKDSTGETQFLNLGKLAD